MSIDSVRTHYDIRESPGLQCVLTLVLLGTRRCLMLRSTCSGKFLVTVCLKLNFHIFSQLMQMNCRGCVSVIINIYIFIFQSYRADIPWIILYNDICLFTGSQLKSYIITNTNYSSKTIYLSCITLEPSLTPDTHTYTHTHTVLSN